MTISLTSFVSYLILASASVVAQTSLSAPSQETAKRPPLNSAEISKLRTKADAGEADAQTALGKAYKEGEGVPQNDEAALKWFRKAADQGNAAAENDLGIMYRMGEGVARDKEEAVRWYQKAAFHGSAQGMFNLGVSYYNGDGVPSNEFTAYAWFLLAQDAGDPAADDAVKRSTATMAVTDRADTLMQIADMYEKGQEQPKNEEQVVRWLRKAADVNSQGKIRLATHLVNGPDAAHNYGEALDLCRAAAKDYAPGQYCMGFMYRKGWGVGQDYAEAIKWFQKAAAVQNVPSMYALAEMYAAGEGTKVDRPAAFLFMPQAEAPLDRNKGLMTC